jgi:hypothetical protein
VQRHFGQMGQREGERSESGNELRAERESGARRVGERVSETEQRAGERVMGGDSLRGELEIGDWRRRN